MDDPKYNFDAPRLHGDLSEMADEMDGADEWFDDHTDTVTPQKHSGVLKEETFGGGRVASEFTSDNDEGNDSPQRTVTPRRPDRQRRTTGGKENRNNSHHSAGKSERRGKVPPRVGASTRVLQPTAASRSRAHAISNLKKPPSNNHPPTTLQLTVPVTPEFMRRSMRSTAAKAHQQGHESRKPQGHNGTRPATSNRPLKLTVPVTPTFMRRENNRPRKASALAAAEKSRAVPKSRTGGCPKALTLTVPVTPNCVRRGTRNRRPPILSSEEQELQKIEASRVQKVEERDKHLRVREQLAHSEGYMPVRSNKALTEPSEFSFARTHPMKMRRRTMDRRIVSVANNAHLRHYTPKKPKARHSAPSMTEPEPFKFHTTIRGPKHDKTSANKPAKSFAATLRHRNESRATTRDAGALTVPVSPKLHKGHRRTARVLSQAERELELMESIKPFKARPVNKTVMNSCGQYGVPKIAKKALTEPKEFSLVSESRLHNHGIKDDDSFERPPPRDTTASLTVPMSPALSTRSRVRATVPVEEEPAHEPFRANPIPDYESMAGLHPVERRKLTRPEPFSFEESNAQRRAKHEEQIAIARSEVLGGREFRANPLPRDTPEKHPKKAHRPLTQPQEFSLESAKRHEIAQDTWEDKIYAEDKERRLARNFRAKPCTVTETAPFTTTRSSKALTEIEGFNLSSEFRGQDRQMYDDERKEREAEMENQKAIAKAERRRMEEEEVRRLRSQRTFRANGIQNYKKMDILPSHKKLTEPVSPRMTTRRRRMATNMR